MTTRFITAILLYTLLSGNLCASQRTWIFLRDKGVVVNSSTDELEALKGSWPKRSLERRAKSGVGVDINDLPICEEYIDAIIEAGGRIEEQSRWLNTVSIENDESIIEVITGMPFVLSVQPVKSFNTDRTLLKEKTSVEIDPKAEYIIHTDGSLIPAGAYGPSYKQAELAGVIEAHDRGLTGAGVLLGMLDTGFHLNHRAFAGLEVIAQYDFIFNDSDPSWDPRTDRKGQANHGTGCLSVIAGYDPGNLVGIAPRVSVALAKTELTGSETRSEEDYWIAGIEWLEWLGADVVTSSLSYSDWYGKNDFNGTTPLVTRAAERACELGVVICNSAGNEGSDAVTIGAPADAFSVLAVAATDSMGVITGFSSRGPSSDGRIKPDIAAMGKDVVCVKPLSWSQYSRWNGTSLSCPIVAGVVALVIEAHPEWSASKVVEAIRTTAKGAEKADNTYGYGVVDAVEAVDYPSLSGRVVSVDDGKAHEGVKIVLHRQDLQIEQITDTWGRFKFANLSEGVYHVILEVDGNIVAERKELILPPSLYCDFIVD